MNKIELIELLKNTEETILLELLELNSENIVDAFLDKIEECEDRIRRYYE